MRSSIAGEVLRSEADGGVLTLTLNRPDRRNAIDPELRDALAAALDADVRGVVITDADAALRAGLLSELAPAVEELPAVAAARVERMLGCAPLSFAAAERLLQMAADVDQRSGMLAESLARTALLATEDHREGLAAGREKRAPAFNGT